MSFGGIQVILFGDFFQLAPVGDDDEWGEISSQYCFESPLWKEMYNKEKKNEMELTICYRQKGDDTFIKLLNQVRKGKISRRNHELLQTRMTMNGGGGRRRRRRRRKSEDNTNEIISVEIDSIVNKSR
jgi:hypothetical protein